MTDTKRDGEAHSASGSSASCINTQHDWDSANKCRNCGMTRAEFARRRQQEKEREADHVHPQPAPPEFVQPWDTTPLRDMLAAAALPATLQLAREQGRSLDAGSAIPLAVVRADEIADEMLTERERKREKRGRVVTVTSRYLPGHEPMHTAFPMVTGTVTTPPPIAPPTAAPCTRSHRCGWEGPCNGTPRFPLCDEPRGYKGAVIRHAFHINEPRCQCGHIRRHDRTGAPIEPR